MITIYGSEMCPDCRNCKINFDKYHIEYEFIDINESLKNLKKFLYYRDHYKDVFDRLIQIGDIGLPCLVDGENVFTDWETYLRNLGFRDLEYEENPNVCHIGKGGC